jgi:AcrR family transcriptional regulator
MVKQERAMRTRNVLVRAAASQFALNGYEGTSLVQIKQEAGLSMGALTFHFKTKAELADTVEARGKFVVECALERVTEVSAPWLDLLTELTVELSRLLEENVFVQSTARLGRERPGSPDWSTFWLPEIKRLAELAHEGGELFSPTAPGDVTALARLLVAGAETRIRDEGAAASPDAVADELTRVWRLVRPQISDPDQ